MSLVWGSFEELWEKEPLLANTFGGHISKTIAQKHLEAHKSLTRFKRGPGKCMDLMRTNRKYSFLRVKLAMGFNFFHHWTYTI